MLPLEPAHAAPERQPGDARVPNDADRTGESVLLRGAVKLLEQRASFDAGCSLRWIDFDRAHAGEVNDHAAVTRREAGDAVAAPADRDHEVALACEADRCDDVLGPSAPRDERRVAVGDRVPDDARGVVVSIAWKDQLAVKIPPKLFKRDRIERLGRRHASLPARRSLSDHPHREPVSSSSAGAAPPGSTREDRRRSVHRARGT